MDETENITIQILNNQHLGITKRLTEKERGLKLTGHTAGGISVAAASNIQMTPLRKIDISMNKDNHC